MVSCYQKFQTSQTSRQLKSCSVEFRHCLTIIYPWIPNLTAFPNIFACPQKDVTGHCYMSSYILCILKIQPKFRKYVICNWCQSNRKKKKRRTPLKKTSAGVGDVQEFFLNLSKSLSLKNNFNGDIRSPGSFISLYLFYTSYLSSLFAFLQF